jgi:hypothetical protein
MQLGLPHSVRTQVVFKSKVVRRINGHKRKQWGAGENFVTNL